MSPFFSKREEKFLITDLSSSLPLLSKAPKNAFAYISAGYFISFPLLGLPWPHQSKRHQLLLGAKQPPLPMRHALTLEPLDKVLRALQVFSAPQFAKLSQADPLPLLPRSQQFFLPWIQHPPRPP